MHPADWAHVLKYGVPAVVLLLVLWLLIRDRIGSERGRPPRRAWLFPCIALLAGPLMGAGLWAILVLPSDDLITMYERVDFLPRFLGMGLFVGVIVSVVITLLERRRS